MVATNSPFSLAGITHPTTFQGLSSFFLASGAPFRMKYCPQSEVQPAGLPIIARTNGRILWEVHHKPVQLSGLPCLRQLTYHILLKWVPFLMLHPVLLPQTASLPGQWFSSRSLIPYRYLH